jgi:hypothetical protein
MTVVENADENVIRDMMKMWYETKHWINIHLSSVGWFFGFVFLDCFVVRIQIEIEIVDIQCIQWQKVKKGQFLWRQMYVIHTAKTFHCLPKVKSKYGNPIILALPDMLQCAGTHWIVIFLVACGCFLLSQIFIADLSDKELQRWPRVLLLVYFFHVHRIHVLMIFSVVVSFCWTLLRFDVLSSIIV